MNNETTPHASVALITGLAQNSWISSLLGILGVDLKTPLENDGAIDETEAKTAGSAIGNLLKSFGLIKEPSGTEQSNDGPDKLFLTKMFMAKAAMQVLGTEMGMSEEEINRQTRTAVEDGIQSATLIAETLGLDTSTITNSPDIVRAKEMFGITETVNSAANADPSLEEATADITSQIPSIILPEPEVETGPADTTLSAKV